MRPAIEELLRRSSETWQPFMFDTFNLDPLTLEPFMRDPLTAPREEAFHLLIYAGWAEHRGRCRYHMKVHPLTLEFTFTAAGKDGWREVAEKAHAAMWPVWRDAYLKAYPDGKPDNTFFSLEFFENEWRLTEEGAKARKLLMDDQLDIFFLHAWEVTRRHGPERRTNFVRIWVPTPVDSVGKLFNMKKVDVAVAQADSIWAEQAQTVHVGPQSAEAPAEGEAVKTAEGKKLSARAQIAYGQFARAARDCPGKNGRAPTDRQCYDWLTTHNDDEKLPAFETWQRYVREARRCHGQQKNTPRTGRAHGRSIVSTEEVEPPDTE